LYNDHEGFEEYNYQEDPPFVHYRYHFDKYIDKLRVIYSLPKFERKKIDLKKELKNYCLVAKLNVALNISKHG